MRVRTRAGWRVRLAIGSFDRCCRCARWLRSTFSVGFVGLRTVGLSRARSPNPVSFSSAAPTAAKRGHPLVLRLWGTTALVSGDDRVDRIKANRAKGLVAQRTSRSKGLSIALG